eukprot:5062280-Pyramimonas_sp.AAC.1
MMRTYGMLDGAHPLRIECADAHNMFTTHVEGSRIPNDWPDFLSRPHRNVTHVPLGGFPGLVGDVE